MDAAHDMYIGLIRLHILHRMETRGLLMSKKKTVDGRIRRVYRATPDGRRALGDAKAKRRELFSELIEGEEAR